MMKKLMLVAAAVALFSVPTFAQTDTNPSSRVRFEQPGTAADVATYTFRAYLDNAATGVTVAATCAPITTDQQVCTVPIPATTPGTHTIQLTAANAAGESAKSASASFRLVAVPSAPSALTILP